ncbi:poly(U)-specific 3'-to-5' RNA exonuclease, variant 2 [Entomophthora muscae]|uniref:Poly(U)-specific 3'-to-5' RNA exonuclease, variant 2 n=1 Tax=Entomophthora muscae TaxID=34485 RepID=A0ACC2UC18_9FUNG|nr:poly(U)-specific 3'-to-5' RNA exonuclease, variant 2 [Entomophthora muscae]
MRNKKALNLQSRSKRKRKSTESTDHQGRVRSIPHKEGDWATFVFIKIPVSNEIRKWLGVLERQSNKIYCQENKSGDLSKTYIQSCISVSKPYLSLSLSRTVYLKWAHIERFKIMLAESIQSSKSFDLSFSGLVTFENEEKTRSFLSLDVHPNSLGPPALHSLLNKVDAVMKKLQLSTFYQFHVSLLWTTPPEKLTEALCQRIQADHPELLLELAEFEIPVGQVSCKIGKRMVGFPLK